MSLNALLVLAVIALSLYMNWRIVAKTGRSGWWSLLTLIPMANLGAVWLFAYVDWPAVDKPKPGGQAASPDQPDDAPLPPPS